MAVELTGTKAALVAAAGELFARKGLEGASVREIAEKAGANVAAVNYHFGSKENLYKVTLEAVACKDSYVAGPQAFFEEARGLTKPREFSDLIYRLARAKFAEAFAPDHPWWHVPLLVRSCLEPSPGLQEVLTEHFEPDFEALKGLFRLAAPEIPEDQIESFAISFEAEIVFYMFAKKLILMHWNMNDYDPAFLEAAAAHVGRVITAALGLPSADAVGQPAPTESDPSQEWCSGQAEGGQI